MHTRQVSNAKLLMLLVVRFFVLSLVIAAAATSILFLPRFTFEVIPEAKEWPHLLGVWANFDGVHYLGIAREGYHDIDRAFFPLYPFLVRFVSSVTINNIFITGFILSQLFFIGGVLICHKVLKEVFHLEHRFRFLMLLLAYPTSFFFSAVYTESLFFFLIVASLYLMYKKTYRLLFFVLVCASLTRIQGVFLVLPLFFSLYDQRISFKKNLWNIFTTHPIIFSPFLGIFMYMMYLFFATGNPMYFLTVQSSFGAHRSSEVILLPQVFFRYVRIFMTASFNFQYAIAVVEFVLFTVALILTGIHTYWSIKKKAMKECGIALFSLANLILPTLTGTLSSTPRYSLFALSIFFVLSKVKLTTFYVVLGIFVLFQCILLAFFAQGYFVS